MARHLQDVVDDDAIRREGYKHTPYRGQWWMTQRTRTLLLDTLRSAAPPGGRARVLEVGASHGSIADVLLAAGAEVILREATHAALDAAQAAYGTNDRFTAQLDTDLALTGLDSTADLAVLVSAMHHVPDYVALLDKAIRAVRVGGSLLTVSDPLFYPRLPASTRRADRGAYLLWRLGRGDVRSGVSAMRRRLRGEMPQEAPAGEITYYHVVRQGVDEQAVLSLLREHFEQVELITYWSNHLGPVRPVADRLGMVNTFAVRATGRR